MLAILQGLSSLGAWAAGLAAAKWGYKVALVAAIVAVYATVWTAIIALISALIALLPSYTFSDFLLQFFPSRSAITTASTAYLGTMATMRSFDYWKAVTGLAAKVGS